MTALSTVHVSFVKGSWLCSYTPPSDPDLDPTFGHFSVYFILFTFPRARRFPILFCADALLLRADCACGPPFFKQDSPLSSLCLKNGVFHLSASLEQCRCGVVFLFFAFARTENQLLTPARVTILSFSITSLPDSMGFSFILMGLGRVGSGFRRKGNLSKVN